jgi:hypothetical protein
VIVHLERDGDAIALEVSDDGVGIAPDALTRSKSHGLLGMRERALLLGGKLEVGRGVNDVGTCVRARIPLSNGHPAEPGDTRLVSQETEIPPPAVPGAGFDDQGRSVKQLA